jgi:hypothetical protein
MIPLLRRSAIVAMVAMVAAPLAVGSAASGDEPAPTTLPPRPVSDSVDRVVARVLEEQKTPCEKAKQDGIPCFPVSREVSGPTISVRDILRDLGSEKGPAPDRPPTREEMSPFRPGPAALVAPLFGFDPGCAGKAAIKRLKGRNDAYYLYRVRNQLGEQVLMYDHSVEPGHFQGDVEFLGRIDGECEAVAAYRRADRQISSSPPPPSTDPE